ncbi:hypothetical protein M8J77_017607 [Diaphorina citri]|nr:hypothetical protein M8J77_017607 [Diaphorina citri]
MGKVEQPKHSRTQAEGRCCMQQAAVFQKQSREIDIIDLQPLCVQKKNIQKAASKVLRKQVIQNHEKKFNDYHNNSSHRNPAECQDACSSQKSQIIVLILSSERNMIKDKREAD